MTAQDSLLLDVVRRRRCVDSARRLDPVRAQLSCAQHCKFSRLRDEPLLLQVQAKVARLVRLLELYHIRRYVCLRDELGNAVTGIARL